MDSQEYESVEEPTAASDLKSTDGSGEYEEDLSNEFNESAALDDGLNDKVTVGEGEKWEHVRNQADSEEALTLRDEVTEGADLFRVITRPDQELDGAQFWAAESIDGIGAVESFNEQFGVAGDSPESDTLDRPGLLSGRMSDNGTFITSPARTEYNSDAELPQLEIVAERGDVETTGYTDLTPRPTLENIAPDDVKKLGSTGMESDNT